MTVDADGNLWVAMYGGGTVRSYTPAGRATEVIAMPVSKVTSCALGGAGLDELYITTSRENLPDDAEATAGTVFRALLGARGLAGPRCHQ